VKDGPAERGAQAGDVIVEFDGKPSATPADLPLLVARRRSARRQRR
jgi:S1-C subfamily serine protease